MYMVLRSMGVLQLFGLYRIRKDIRFISSGVFKKKNFCKIIHFYHSECQRSIWFYIVLAIKSNLDKSWRTQFRNGIKIYTKDFLIAWLHDAIPPIIYPYIAHKKNDKDLTNYELNCNNRGKSAGMKCFGCKSELQYTSLKKQNSSRNKPPLYRS